MRDAVASLLCFACLGAAPAAFAGEVESTAADKVVAVRRVALPHAVPGEEIVLEKAIDSAGRIVLRATAPRDLSLAELEELRTRERELLLARYGKLSPDLYEAFDQLGVRPGTGERVAVVVTLRQPEVRHPDKYRHGEKALAAHGRVLAGLQPLAAPRAIAERYGIVPQNLATLEADGQIRALLDHETLRRLAQEPAVATIDPYIEPEPAYPFTTYNTSAFNPGPLPYDAQGSGVRAGTFETGIHPDLVSCMSLTAANVDLNSGAGLTSHSNQTFKAMWNSAPLVTAYHRNSFDYSTAASKAWIIDKGLQTLSQSTTTFAGHTSPLGRTMDDFSYHAPFTLFANPTGNDGFGYSANWTMYNGINVGNVRETEERYYELPGCTQTRNPGAQYGGPIPGGSSDRELPNVVAPGYYPYASDAGAADGCLGSFGLWCGTSISAPVVNGLAAAVISADARMKNATEKVKAALMVTARNVEAGYSVPAVEENDGAGVVSGADAVWFARNHTTVAPNGEARHGMAGGSLTNANESNVLTFSIRTPQVKPIGKHLRAVLVWTSNPELNASVNTLSDLDLTLSTAGGTVLAGSYALDDNVEIVDIPADSLAANTLYPVKIHVVDMRITPNASAQHLYYALAWTWVQDIFAAAPSRGGYGVGATTATDCSSGSTAAILLGSANRLCTEMGNKASGAYTVQGPQSGVHTWWTGTAWSTSGNANVCYVKNLRCEGHDVPHYANPAPIAHYQLGVAATPCVAGGILYSTASRFCLEQGYDTYDTFELDGPKSGVHTWWNGSGGWTTSGNSNACYIKNLKCKNV